MLFCAFFRAETNGSERTAPSSCRLLIVSDRIATVVLSQRSRSITNEITIRQDADEPPVLLGEDRGANPVEYVLHALAACMTTSMVYHAAARGITIEAVGSRLEGDLDLQGFLGLSDEVRKGYQGIRAVFRVRSGADAETLRALVEYSPVYEMVSGSVPVTVEIRKI